MPYKSVADRNARQRQRRADKKRAGMVPLPTPPPSPPVPAQGDVVAAWAMGNLKVPTGPLRGQPFHVPDWQRDFLNGALGPTVREAGLSCARKNGKSGLIAALLLAYLVGPLHSANWRAVVVSLTGALAAELRTAIVQTAEVSGLPVVGYRSPLPGYVLGKDGARVDILASDKATGHAVGCDLAIIDEGGLIQENGRDLWGAVFSSISGRNGRLLVISIRGDGPMFAELAEREGHKSVYFKEYAAQEDAQMDDPAAWTAANPGLADGIKSTSYMADAASRAGASTADARLFRAHDLNQPQNPAQETLCDPGDWMACESDELPERNGWCVLGFDAGGSSSMTAAVALWESGRMEAWAAFPDIPDLLTRSRGDNVGRRYLTMYDRGELRTYPGRVTPVGDFLTDVAADLAQRPDYIAADQYRRADVTDALSKAGLSGWDVDWRRMGTGPDGAQDVRAMQRLVLGKGFTVRPTVLIPSAIRESIIRYDANGNPALDKRRQKGRIDVLQAGILAAGLYERKVAERPRIRYHGLI